MRVAASKAQPGPFRVFFGDEDLLLDQALAGARNQANREVVLLDGEGLNGTEVVAICETRSMSGADRRVVIDNAHKVKHHEDLVRFIKEREASDTSVALVVVARTTKPTTSWLKAMMDRGETIKCLKPKPWEVEKQHRCIQKQAKRIGVKLGDGVPDLLIKFLGYDLRLIVNELRKLACLVEGGVAEKKHVAALVPYIFPAKPFEVAEAAAAKNLKKAMTLLGFVYQNFGEGAAIPITYSLMRLVERLIIARQMLDQGDEPRTVAERLSMHEYAFQKNLQPLVLKHTVTRLREQMRTLCRLDALVKGPARSKRTQVELALLSFAT